MADILFRCPECSSPLAVDDGCVGQKIECPECKTAVSVPKAETIFQCTNSLCQTELSAPAALVGKTVDCPNCGTDLTIPLKRIIRLKRPTPGSATADSSSQPVARQCPCGSPLKPSDHALCWKCAAEQWRGSASSGTPQPRHESTGKREWPKEVGQVLLFIGAVVILTLVLMQFSDSKHKNPIEASPTAEEEARRVWVKAVHETQLGPIYESEGERRLYQAQRDARERQERKERGY